MHLSLQRSGAQLVWLVDRDSRTVQVCHSLEDRVTLSAGGSLEGEKLLPGFSLPVATLFKEWDWE